MGGPDVGADEDEGGLELGGEAEDGSGVSCGAAAPRSEPPPAPPPEPVDGAEAGGAADFVLPTPPLVPRPGVPVAPAAAGVPPSPEPDVPLPPEAPWPCAPGAPAPRQPRFLDRVRDVLPPPPREPPHREVARCVDSLHHNPYAVRATSS